MGSRGSCGAPAEGTGSPAVAGSPAVEQEQGKRGRPGKSGRRRRLGVRRRRAPPQIHDWDRSRRPQIHRLGPRSHRDPCSARPSPEPPPRELELLCAVPPPSLLIESGRGDAAVPISVRADARGSSAPPPVLQDRSRGRRKGAPPPSSLEPAGLHAPGRKSRGAGGLGEVGEQGSAGVGGEGEENRRV
jgi:hypothetical protein